MRMSSSIYMPMPFEYANGLVGIFFWFDDRFWRVKGGGSSFFPVVILLLIFDFN